MNLDNIIDYLCKQFDSGEYNKEILKYGLQVLIYNLFTILIILTISILFENLQFGLMFLIFFGTLRVSFGGFHCKTLIGCTTLMTSISILVNILSKIVIYKNIIELLALIMIGLLFFIKPCKENTFKLKYYNVCYKYIFIFIFLLINTNYKNSIIFVPAFSALLFAEIMYYIKSY